MKQKILEKFNPSLYQLLREKWKERHHLELSEGGRPIHNSYTRYGTATGKKALAVDIAHTSFPESNLNTNTNPDVVNKLFLLKAKLILSK